MSRLIISAAGILSICTLSALGQSSKVLFDNQSGEPALVRLIGPTQVELAVPSGSKAGTQASGGRYLIRVRYGTPGNYRYAQGDEFTVTETATATSETTITLHKVVAGNYDSHPISEDDFRAAEQRPHATPAARADSERQSPAKAYRFQTPKLTVTIEGYRIPSFLASGSNNKNLVPSKKYPLGYQGFPAVEAKAGQKLLGLLCSFDPPNGGKLPDNPEAFVILTSGKQDFDALGIGFLDMLMGSPTADGWATSKFWVLFVVPETALSSNATIGVRGSQTEPIALDQLERFSEDAAIKYDRK